MERREAMKKGQMVGQYLLTGLLGKGGFSEVYLGQHGYLQSLAAIKLLNTPLTHDALEGFLVEARRLRQMIHPHIIQVLDWGIEDETPYLVMEYASGGTLRKRHPARQPISLATVISYCHQIADALNYMHEQGVIHRDLKPENLLLGPSGELLLSDFSLAIINTHSSHYIPTVNVEGTLAYMAPEQFRGKPQAASDQYALAVMVYE